VNGVRHLHFFRSHFLNPEVLGAMVKFRCRRGCRAGGGNPQCKIRNCVRKREIAGCWECGEFKECKKLDFLRGVHDDAHLKKRATPVPARARRRSALIRPFF
jgi:hypothetical protein